MMAAELSQMASACWQVVAHTRRTKTASASRSLVNEIDLPERSGCDRRDDELRDAVAWSQLDSLATQIDQAHSDDATIVAVDGPWRIGDRQTMSTSKTAARSDLPFVSVRYRHTHTDWHSDAFQ